MTHKFTLTIKLANDLKDYENKDKKFSIRNHSYLYYIHFAKLNCLYDRLYDVAIIIFFLIISQIIFHLLQLSLVDQQSYLWVLFDHHKKKFCELV